MATFSSHRLCEVYLADRVRLSCSCEQMCCGALNRYVKVYLADSFRHAIHVRHSGILQQKLIVRQSSHHQHEVELADNVRQEGCRV